MCSRSHVGVTCIFAMGWVLLYHLIGKYIKKCPEFNNVFFLLCLVKISFCHLEVHFISNYYWYRNGMNHGWVPILLTPVFHWAICDEVINRVNVWVITNIKLTRVVHLNSPIPPIIKLPYWTNNIWHHEIVSGIDSSGVTRWFGIKLHMDTLEGLADDVFNVLPIVTFYPLHYFICVIIGNNSIEEA